MKCNLNFDTNTASYPTSFPGSEMRDPGNEVGDFHPLFWDGITRIRKACSKSTDHCISIGGRLDYQPLFGKET